MSSTVSKSLTSPASTLQENHRLEAMMGTNGTPLLQVTDLTVDLPTMNGSVRIVDGFSLTLNAGQRVALVGESGSGKSVTARAIMRLDKGAILGGSVRLGDTELTSLSQRQLRRIRGSQIAMVFQNPLNALDPRIPIGRQVAEPLIIRGVKPVEARIRAEQMLDELGVARAHERYDAYPHEFSGGMRQRVVIAMALIAEPQVLLADEPTTALDVRIQEQVLSLLDDITSRRGIAVLMITHDLGTVAGFADRVAVMYSGRKVEEDNVTDLFRTPRHPYTQGLLAAVPRIDQQVARLQTIPGTPPPPTLRPSGCAFHPRCPVPLSTCSQEIPSLVSNADSGEVACLLYSSTGGAQ